MIEQVIAQAGQYLGWILVLWLLIGVGTARIAQMKGFGWGNGLLGGCLLGLLGMLYYGFMPDLKCQRSLENIEELMAAEVKRIRAERLQAENPPGPTEPASDTPPVQSNVIISRICKQCGTRRPDTVEMCPGCGSSQFAATRELKRPENDHSKAGLMSEQTKGKGY